MIEILFFIIGLLLVLWIFLDIIFTTYSMEGGGKLTDLFLQTSWKLFLWISRYDGRHRILGLAGMSMMISLILLWGLGLWLGVFFIFASDPGSVLHANTNNLADLWEKLYFSGYVLTTMGLGDFVPSNGKWGVVSAFFSFFGLVFITLMVSYALPVLSNIIAKKQLSLFIQHFGETPQELLLHFWNGKDFFDLKYVSKDLQQKILTLAKSHKAYPILHYFHSTSKEESLIITLCIVDEALTILMNNTSPEQWDIKKVLPLRKALDNYVETIETTYRHNADHYRKYERDDLKPPDLQPLIHANVKMILNEKVDYRRKKIWTHLLQSKGWTWQEIYPHHEKNR